MKKLSSNKFAVFFFTFIIASFSQLNLKAALGWSPELIMSMLVVAGFYLSVLEIAALSAFGIFILNWQPFPEWEIILYFLLPFVIISAKNIFPWSGAINGILGAVLSTAVFYAISNFGAIISNPMVFINILILTAVFSFVLFQLFNFLYKIHSN